MKRLFLILFTILISNSIFAQSENYKIAMDNFINNYNADQYEKIYDENLRQEKLKVKNFSAINKELIKVIKPSLRKWC